jgi:hypothetical protein
MKLLSLQDIQVVSGAKIGTLEELAVARSAAYKSLKGCKSVSTTSHTRGEGPYTLTLLNGDLYGSSESILGCVASRSRCAIVEETIKCNDSPDPLTQAMKNMLKME